jgi:hypothetical protein
MSAISAGTTATTTLQVSGDTTGTLVLQTNDTGAGGTTAITIGTDQSVNFPVTAQRITGDFTTATVNSRPAFQTSTANSSTGIYALPNGSSTAASWQAANNSDPTNASKILIATNGSTDVQLVSGINGTGTYLPLSIFNGGVGTFVFGTSGQFGIGPVATVSYGTSGQVLTSGGASAAPTWSAVSASPIPTVDVKTTGTSATWTIPTGITKVRITVVGGGGGVSATNGWGGGGGGGTAIKTLTGLTPGNTLTYTVGAGGSAGVSGNGGTSQVASGTQTITTISATGGTGQASSFWGQSGGIGSNGDLNIGGGAGGIADSTDAYSGTGGSSYLGGGGRGGADGSTPGQNGRPYGGGAGGGSTGAGGFTGAAGVVIFEY